MPRELKTKRIHVRASEQMIDLLEQQAAEAGMTKSRYVTYLIEREHKAKLAAGDELKTGAKRVPVLVYKYPDLCRIEWQLCKWGNNLNQAASALNTLAEKQYPSDLKSQILIEQSARRIEQSDTAITRIAHHIGKLSEARHIVMSPNDR